MMRSRQHVGWVAGLVCSVAMVACNTGTSTDSSTSSSGDPNTASSSGGASSGTASSGGSGSSGSGSSSGGGSSSATMGQSSGNIIRQPNSAEPTNNNRDSDCDGLTDEEEFSLTYAGGTRTNPNDPDSDDDGIFDGTEAGRTTIVTGDASACGTFDGDADPATRTNPTQADTDGDGIADGREDANRNGRRDAGETDPLDLDSDGDGLPDALEDSNKDGTRQPTETSAAERDTDGDGIPDGIEDQNRDGTRQPNETDPRNPDTDADGLVDGAEDINWNHVVDAGESNPLMADTDTDNDGIPDSREVALGYDAQNPDMDGDGLKDGEEDRNKNGIIEANETNPRRADSDCDGLKDGDEDANGNGQVDTGETDPRARDSDGDLLPDGLERGVTVNPDPINCAGFTADADPGTTTNPSAADSDNDGLNDGIEDRDRNGRVDNNELNPNTADGDGDGLLDGAEDVNGNGIVDVGETSPFSSDRDTDSDGLSDAAETRLGTSPSNPDTDGDLINDGTEDKNRDGVFSIGETNPLSRDTDCDGVGDGEEDVNRDGTRQPTELDPLKADTDADGLSDGVEQGRTVNLDAQRCTAFVASASPPSNTDPLAADSDMDGIADGTEDANQNGRVDMGELNPRNGGDAAGPDTQACATQNLRPVVVISRSGQKADLLLAVSPEYTTVTDVLVNGEQRGAMVFNPTRNIAGFAFKLTPGLAGANETAQLGNVEQRMTSAGSQTDKQTISFTRWDGFRAALASYTYQDAANDNVAKAANDLLKAILDTNAQGLLDNGLSGETGPFRLQLEVVRRSAQTSVVVGALTRKAAWDTSFERVFNLDDVSNGSPLAQFGDTTGVQCDRLTVQPRTKMDFVWVVDNSGSMSNEQTAVSTAAQAIADQLGNSTVDWRLAALASDTDVLENNGNQWSTYTFPDTDPATCNADNNTYGQGPRYCEFVGPAGVQTFRQCMDAIDVCGSGSEHFFRPLACVMGAQVGGKYHCGRSGGDGEGRPTEADNNGDGFPDAFNNGYNPAPSSHAMLPRAPNDPRKIRTGARVAFLFLTDANEQSDGRFSGAAQNNALSLSTIPRWVQFVQNFDGLGTPESRAFVGGITCPAGSGCTDENSSSYMNYRWPTFFSAAEGAFADLPGDGTPNQGLRIGQAVANILDRAIGSASPYILTKPPISASIKVATEALTEGTCNTADVPRSKVNGWDYNPTTRAIVFTGDCRPRATEVGKRISVSYRYWQDNSPNADGQMEPCGGQCTAPLVCNPATMMCECPADCGEASGCAAPTVCDTRVSVCACACPADCGGSPPNPRFVCNTGSCQFECPADCGGASPGPQFTCNRTTCQYECTACNPATRPGVQWTCDLAACDWRCPSDCAIASPGPGYRCNPTTCTYACAPDCAGSCRGTQTCNTNTCACDCQQNVTCGAGLRFDTTACACACDTAALNCGPGYMADANACACVCQPNCGGRCTGDEMCVQSLCLCEGFGG